MGGGGGGFRHGSKLEVEATRLFDQRKSRFLLSSPPPPLSPSLHNSPALLLDFSLFKLNPQYLNSYYSTILK